MIVCAVISIGFLVFIHEGGHYLAARAFGVRVTEFMLGLPGPSIGFTKGETRYGVTAVPLGGYAKVCGMEAGPLQPHLQEVLASLYRRGIANMEDVARDCGISDDEAYNALEELVEWGSVIGPSKADQYNTYRAPRVTPGKRALKKAAAAGLPTPVSYELGQAREVADPHALYESEYRQQYRSLPFWKRSVILLAGIFMNLLFAMLVFIIVFSIIGFQVQHPETGEITTIHASVLQALQAGFMYIGMVIQAVVGLFNPATAAQTVSDSTSIVGIAVMSKDYFQAGLVEALYIGMVIQAVVGLFNPATAAQTVSDSTSIVGIAVMSKDYFQAGLVEALEFMAMISVSLGIMNLLPIPPLDGGRFVVEIFQKGTRKTVSQKAMNYMSLAGMALFLGFFVIMLNQDIQRFVFGNWG